MWVKAGRRIFAHSFQPAVSPKALTRISRDIRSWALHHRSDKSLTELAQMSDPEEDRCLCHPVGTPQVQADASPDQGRERLVRSDTPGQPNTLCSLDVMSWQRPNIGSRVTREGHARLWEHPEVKFLRATRHRSHAAMSRRWAGQSRRKTEYHTDWRSTFACRWRRAATKAGSLRCQPRPKGGDGPASSPDRRRSPQGGVAGGMIAARRLAAIVAVNVPECLFWVMGGGSGKHTHTSALPQEADLLPARL